MTPLLAATGLLLVLVLAACGPDGPADPEAGGDQPPMADGDLDPDELPPLVPIVSPTPPSGLDDDFVVEALPADGEGPRLGRWPITELSGEISSVAGGQHALCGDGYYIFSPIDAGDGELIELEPLVPGSVVEELPAELRERYVSVAADGTFSFHLVFVETLDHYQMHSNETGSFAHLGGSATATGAWTWLPNRAAGTIEVESPFGASRFELNGRFLDPGTLVGEWSYESNADGSADCSTRDRGSGSWKAATP